MYFIEEITYDNKHYLNESLEAIKVTSRLKVKFEDDQWSYTEVPVEIPFMKSYEEEHVDLDQLIEDVDRTIYFAVLDGKPVGQIIIKKHWNHNCYIDNIAVKQKERGQGVGSLLIKVAEQWAKGHRLKGLTLETQDINVPACRLYKKNGFEIGGIDNLLYTHLPTREEQAIHWYKRF